MKKFEIKSTSANDFPFPIEVEGRTKATDENLWDVIARAYTKEIREKSRVSGARKRHAALVERIAGWKTLSSESPVQEFRVQFGYGLAAFGGTTLDVPVIVRIEEV